MKEYLKNIIKLSNHLDSMGLTKEADFLDVIILKYSEEYFQYKVKSGDVLGTIAQNHGVSVKDIQDANKMGDSTNIIAGKFINIPGNYENQVVAATLLGEVGTTSKSAMPAIMKVIKNRADVLGKSKYEIVTDSSQFSYWNGKNIYDTLKGNMGRKHKLWEDALKVASEETSLPDIGGATHYYALSMSNPPYWAKSTAPCWTETYRDSHHVFGKDTSGRYGSCDPNKPKEE